MGDAKRNHQQRGVGKSGSKNFVAHDLERMQALDLVNIVNLGGHSMDDYLQAVDYLNNYQIDLLELNISCPNVKAGGMNFGVKTEMAREVVREIRKLCKHKLVVKLSPNAEDIVELAKACEAEGADGVSLTNTFLSMAIDINKRKPIFNNVYAGYSGPAIKPIALRMVHQVAHAVNIPVMGIGGITTWQDAIEFIMAGATTIQVGTASFMNPAIAVDIIDGMEAYLENRTLPIFLKSEELCRRRRLWQRSGSIGLNMIQLERKRYRRRRTMEYRPCGQQRTLQLPV